MAAPAQYISRQVTITAVQWTGDNLDDIIDMVGTQPLVWQNFVTKQLAVNSTEYGQIVLNATDWLIDNADGYYSKLSNTAFIAAYELV